MNIILFRPAEVELPLPRHDPRAGHILRVLRRQPGDAFDAGLINGPRGRGTLVAVNADSLDLSFTWAGGPMPPDPVHLLIGLPRPQTARDILRDLTTLGVAALHFIRTEKGEASYAGSKLWQSGEWERHLITGAEQACATLVPEVTHGRSLAEVLPVLPAAGIRLALDNYEAPASLGAIPLDGARAAVLAIGAERGWPACCAPRRRVSPP
jgi:RsmE family RNA methyltransferase